MNRIVRHNASGLVIVVAAGIQIAIKAREIAAGYFDTQSMTGREEVAGVHGLES